jgi:hypothetical protein
MRDLLGRFGQGGFPDAYQVVIRCRVHISQAITGTYEDHVILQER